MDKRVPVMDALLSSPPTEQTIDIAKAVAALHRRAPSGNANRPSAVPSHQHVQRVNSVRRVLATTALGGLLIGGVTVLTSSTTSPSGMAAGAASQSDAVFAKARSGDCVNWPKNAPGQAHLVDCKDEHLFEVAESVAVQSFQQPCQQAVQRYLGSRYDPNSKFSIAVMWPGDTSESGGRQLLCGLQLPGAGTQPAAFAGRIADLDQSKVWPAGTCLGLEPATTQSTDVAVNCAETHAQEITGSVNLATRFSEAPPAPAEQDAVLRDACAQTADAYLAPAGLRDFGLTPIYSPVSPQSWSAGSRQVSCGIGATLGNGLARLVGTAKSRLSINGAAPISPPGVSAPPVNAMLVAAQSEQPARQPAPTTTMSSPTPAPLANPVPAASPAVAPAAAPSPAPAAPLPPVLGPAPGPPPGAEPVPAPGAAPGPPLSPGAVPAAPTEPSAPVGPVIEIPGLAPITLPVFPPPAPPAG